jgi:hypothetical protein
MLQKSNEERAGGFVEDREVGAYDGGCRQLNIDLAALKWAPTRGTWQLLSLYLTLKKCDNIAQQIQYPARA